MHSLTPSCDYVNVTTPAERLPDVEPVLLDYLGLCGAVSRCEGLWDVGEGGTVKMGLRYRIAFYSVSGAAVACLREHGLLEPFLYALGEGEHRVSTLHVALDVPRAAPRVVRSMYRRGSQGEIRLSRKAIPSSQVSRVTRPGVVDGGATGTVYLGKRGRDVRAKVYDKRDQLLCRAVEQHGASAEVIALNDPGPLTRYELELGRHVGVTLRDVCLPEAVFWHYAKGLLRVPAGVPVWEPHGEGFAVPAVDPEPWRQLELLVARSPDIRRAVELADRMGPHGRQSLLTKLRTYVLPGQGLVAAAS